MSEESATPAIKDEPVNPMVVGIVMALVALLVPFGFDFSGYGGLFLSLIAILWMFTLAPWGTRLIIAGIFSLSTWIPFGVLRLAYPYQMVRLYKGRTTKKRTLTLGVVSEIPFAILPMSSLIKWLLNPYDPVLLGVPSLILLIVGILIIRFRPPPESPEIREEMS